MSIVTPVRPAPGVTAKAAHESALARLDAVVAALEAPLDHSAAAKADPMLTAGEPVSNTTEAEYKAMVAQAKDYIAAGDAFQIVLSQRFTSRFDLPAFSLYRALRRVNPSPYLCFLDFGGFQIVVSSPEILGSRARRQGGHPADRRHAAAGQDPERGPGARGRAARRPEGARRTPDAARSRPQRRRPRRRRSARSG